MPEEENKSFSSDQSNTEVNEGGADRSQTFESLGISVEDVVALQKKNEHAQEFIETLKTETQTLRTDMSELKDAFVKGRLIDDALDGADLNNDTQTGLSEGDLLSKAVSQVKAELQEEKAGESRKSNFEGVTKTLTDKYGENVDKHMTKVCEELGITWDEAVKMAEDKPKAALKLFGAEAKAVQSFSQGSINTNAFQQEQESPKLDLMSARRDKDRVQNFQMRLEQQLAKMNA
jgi:hypothetical protein